MSHPMKRLGTFLLLTTTLVFTSCQTRPTPAAAADHVYEMRVYYAPPGKLDDLNARFRNHTMRIFEKHGIHNVGYWMPLDNPDNKLIYLLGYPSREAATNSWKEFFADPEWQAAAKASE